MELRHLRYFVAVAETLNFTKAAAKLRVAQPALSRQVVDLEDEIGVDLFKRSPRGVALTAEGRLFLGEARSILAQADEAVTKTQALARGEFGELHIGYAPSPTTCVAAAPGHALMKLKSVPLACLSQHRPFGANAVGLEFESLRSYPIRGRILSATPLGRRRWFKIGGPVVPVVGLSVRREGQCCRSF